MLGINAVLQYLFDHHAHKNFLWDVKLRFREINILKVTQLL